MCLLLSYRICIPYTLFYFYLSKAICFQSLPPYQHAYNEHLKNIRPLYISKSLHIHSLNYMIYMQSWHRQTMFALSNQSSTLYIKKKTFAALGHMIWPNYKPKNYDQPSGTYKTLMINKTTSFLHLFSLSYF